MKSFLPILALSLPLQAFASGYSFTPLFDSHEPDGPTEVIPYGISGDGLKVAGAVTNRPDGNYDFLWERSSGITKLPSPPSPYATSRRPYITGDGLMVIVNVFPTDFVFALASDAFLWSSIGGYQDILHNGQPATAINISDTSSSGRFHAGHNFFFDNSQTDEPSLRAFRVADGRVEYLGFLNPENPFSISFGISSDGQTVVGSSTNSEVKSEAFVWSPISGMVGLGIAEGFEGSSALGISSSGDFITGTLYEQATPPYDEHGFLWSLTDGMIHIPMPDGFNSLEPFAVSDSGTVVGSAVNTHNSSDRAFLWNQTNGFQYLHEILEANNVDLRGWQLMAITDVTPNGKTLIGYGYTPEGRTGAFIATLPGDCDDESAQEPRQIWGVAFLPVGETSGWLNEWIGYVYYHPDYYPWSFCYGLDWLYTYGNCDGGAWFWSPVADWLYTTPALYPYLYSAKGSKWLYHQRNTEELYDFSTETTLRLRDL